MRNSRRVIAPALAAGLVLSAWGGATAQSPSAGGVPAECDYSAATPVNVQLQWLTQAQFAGFFAAKDMCFYANHGINPTLLEADPTGTPPQVIGSDANGPEFVTLTSTLGLGSGDSQQLQKIILETRSVKAQPSFDGESQ